MTIVKDNGYEIEGIYNDNYFKIDNEYGSYGLKKGFISDEEFEEVIKLYEQGKYLYNDKLDISKYKYIKITRRI